MNTARWQRALAFRSGPETHIFAVCDEHRDRLEDGSAGNGCFVVVPEWPIRPLDLEDDVDCEECREGGL